MALSGLSNANFASGFSTGYGLVGSSLDRQMKKDQLEQSQENTERDFGLKETEAKRLAEYRGSELGIKRQNAGLDAKIKTGQLDNATTSANTAGVRADTS